jgi:hypothetical protein
MSPTQEHEFLIELVRQRPSLAAKLLTEMGVSVPDFDEARLECPDFTECVPTEYRADAVVVLANGKPTAGIVLEVQRKYKKQKHWTWPLYLATLRARIKGPCILLVFCPNRREASLCARAIEMGHPGWTLCPIVIGPDQVPMITDLVRAIAEPELTVLSAIVHGQSEEGFKVLQTFFDSQEHLPEELRGYSDLVLSVLPELVIKNFMEITMAMGTYQPRSKWVREWMDQGRAEEASKVVLRILSNRRIPVSDEAEVRISECAELDVLETWIDKAITVTSADELFG